MRYVITIIFVSSLTALCFAGPRPVSLEDIKDAIMSMVRMFRDLTDKLERHEYRERQLGEVLKKALSSLDKRERGQDHALENIMSKLNKIEDRIQNLENSTRMSEREKGSYTVESDPLQSWMSNVEGILMQSHSKDEYVNKNQLSNLEASINSRLDSLSSNIERLETNILQQAPTTSSAIIDPEKLNSKLESQLEMQAAWHNLVISTLQKNEKLITDLQNSRNNEGVSGITKEIELMRYEVHSSLDKEIAKIENNIIDLHKALSEGQENIIKTLSENNDIAVGFYDIIQKSYEQLSADTKAFGKVEKVLIQTADNVMDTKRRIEYGVQQILLEVGDIIKLQGKEVNATMNKRFDDISETILDNQNGGLTNLSFKIETEISQVWRQIGIMYQQLTASAGALDKLQQQTETYVNGSLHTMDSMEGKVVQITGRMTDVDENLNYLLGRFSLVTQEFNQIKTALATALDNIRSNFRTVNQQIQDVGPGPNPIESGSDASDVDNAV